MLATFLRETDGDQFINLLQGIYALVVVSSLLLSVELRREIETAKRESLYYTLRCGTHTEGMRLGRYAPETVLAGTSVAQWMVVFV